MAVEAVVSVVIQKLTDLLIQESHVSNEVNDAEEVKKMLGGIQSFFIDAGHQQICEEEEAFNKWLEDFLVIVYHLEDVIETFSVQTIRWKRTGFINKCTYIMKDEFNALRSLPGKQDNSIRRSMGDLQRKMNDVKNKLQECKSKMPNLCLVSGSREERENEKQGNGEEQEQEAKAEQKQQQEEEQEAKAESEEREEEEQEQEEEDEEEEESTIFSLTKYEKKMLKQSITEGQENGYKSRLNYRMKRLMQLITEGPEEEESTIIGLKDYLKKLLIQLIIGGEKQHIVCVFGEGGSGKTTLAKMIYNRREIKEVFKIRAWVSVLRDYKVRDILVAILRQVSSFKDEEKLSNNALKERLSECLESNRYLIVLDDVRTADVLEELRGSVPETLNGSRVMFTTREDKLAWQADPGMLQKVQPLNPKDSWKLFFEKVPFLKSSPFLNHQLMLDLEKKIVELCGRLPLKILMLAGLLSSKKETPEEWMSVLKQYECFQLTRPFFHCSDILSFSYNDLPPHLKLCFLYLGVFPKQFEIPVRRLFWLWIAEGFVKRCPGTIPEDLVLEYLDELVKRNMVEISKRKSDGSVKRCRMLGVFHEVFLSKTVDLGLFYIHRSLATPPPKFGLRRVIEHVDVKEDSSSSEFEDENVLSYISFNVKNKATRAVEIGDFLGKVIRNRRGGFRLLRVLDLEGVYKPTLPQEMGSLFNLRYLGLRSTLLTTLPASVCDLPCLETLDIKHTYISTLPHSIWKMKHLRHLCLSETRLEKPNAGGGGGGGGASSIMELQTLWGLFLDKSKSTQNISGGLNRLMNLRKLGVTSDPTTFEELGEWIKKLARLECLQLRSKGKLGQPSELKVPYLLCLENLKRLHLIGTLVDNPPLARGSHSQLTVLILSFSQLQEDPMLTLALLPSLTVLKLLANSYGGLEMNCPQGFPKLRVLNLWKLEELKKWTVAEGSMQNLRSLEIRCCTNLEEFPDTLLKSVAFKELTLTNMPDKFVEGVKKEKHKRVTITVNNWEIS